MKHPICLKLGISEKEYGRLHRQMRKKIPRSQVCQFCFKASPYDLANIHGIYNEEEIHWRGSCRSCHLFHDYADGTRLKPFGDRNPMYGIHRFGEDAPRFGKKHAGETKQKMSLAHVGKKYVDDTKQKMSLTRINTKTVKLMSMSGRFQTRLEVVNLCLPA